MLYCEAKLLPSEREARKVHVLLREAQKVPLLEYRV